MHLVVIIAAHSTTKTNQMNGALHERVVCIVSHAVVIATVGPILIVIDSTVQTENVGISPEHNKFTFIGIIV
jgi:hypothetical protein